MADDDASSNLGSAPPLATDRWDTPVVYLQDYPDHDLSPRGMPYFACPHCRGWLSPLDDPMDRGVMFLCVYGCGQRYWVDKPLR